MQIDISQAAGLLQVPRRTIYRWMRRDRLPSHRPNEQLRFHPADLLEWSAIRGVAVSPVFFRGPEAAPELSLESLLKTGGVHRGVGGADPAGLLEEMFRRLEIFAAEECARLASILAARPSLGFTGVGGGGALPHVRNPIVRPASPPLVGLFFPSSALPIWSADGVPVRAVFLLVSPGVRTHLRMFSRLLFALSRPEFRPALDPRAGSDAIWESCALIDREIEKAPAEERKGGRG